MNVSLVTKKIKISYGVSTNTELATKLGVSVSAIEAWSRRKEIPQKYIFQCTAETGVSIEWLLDEDKPTFHISGENILNSSSFNKDMNTDNELLPLFEALSKVAIALDKKEQLKEELIKLISKLST